MLYYNLIVFIYFLMHACSSEGMNYVVRSAESKSVMRTREDKVYPIIDPAPSTIQRKSKDKIKLAKRFKTQTHRASTRAPVSSPPPADIPVQLLESLITTIQLANQKGNKVQNPAQIIDEMQATLDDIKAKYALSAAKVVTTTTTTQEPQNIVSEMDKLMKNFLRATGSSESGEPVMRGDDKEEDIDDDLNYDLDGEELKLDLAP